MWESQTMRLTCRVLLWDPLLVTFKVFKYAHISALNKEICIGYEAAYHHQALALSHPVYLQKLIQVEKAVCFI